MKKRQKEKNEERQGARGRKREKEERRETERGKSEEEGWSIVSQVILGLQSETVFFFKQH